MQASSIEAKQRFDTGTARRQVLAALNVFNQPDEAASIFQSQRCIAHPDIGIVNIVYNFPLRSISVTASQALFQRALENLCLAAVSALAVSNPSSRSDL